MTSAPPPPEDEDRPGEDPFRKRQPGHGGGTPYDPPGGEPPAEDPGRPGSPYDPPGGERPPGNTPPPPGGANPPPYGGANPPPPGGGNPYGSEPGGGPYGSGPDDRSGNPYGGDPNNPYGDQGPYGGGQGPYGGQGQSPYGPYPGGPEGPPPGDPLAGMAPLAPSGRRVLARVIDMVLVGIVVYLLTLLFRVSETNFDHAHAGRSVGQSFVAAILYIGYDVLMSQRRGQTLGKRLLKLRVARLDNGLTPDTRTLLVRAAVLWLPFAFCCACVWTAICGGWSFIDRPYKQGLHDKAAKTVVVEV
ncbi:RDD family protein [Streptomyces sp. NPDC004959]|uniref:RDD family protein n=1 Tax=Streptomyces sp. NPDC004959 TaxID=3154673 RepID=UPI0033B358C6